MDMSVLMDAASWLMWPLGVCLLVLLIQLIMLVYGLLDCLTIVRYELLPVLKDVRLTASHVEDLSGKAVTTTQLIEKGLRTGQHGVQSVWAGIKKSFNKKR